MTDRLAGELIVADTAEEALALAAADLDGEDGLVWLHHDVLGEEHEEGPGCPCNPIVHPVLAEGRA